MWPCEGNGSSASPGSNSNAISFSQDQTMPTWADRVRGGVARGGSGVVCSPLSSTRPSPSANGGTNKPQVAPSANGGAREKEDSSSDRTNDSEAASGVDHVLQTDREPEKREQDNTGSTQKLKGEEKREEGGEEDGWETVSNSRNQSRNNSATTVRREGATQSVAVRNLDSSNDEERVNEDTHKDGQPSSSSSEASPRHDESSASPPSQVDLTSHSDDLSLVNTDDSDHGLSIEDLASGAAAQLVLDDDGEEEKGEEGFKDKSTDLGGTSTLSQGLSQASDKVCTIV